MVTFFYSTQRLSGNMMQKGNKIQNKDKGKATSTSVNAEGRKIVTVKVRLHWQFSRFASVEAFVSFIEVVETGR